MATYPFVCGTCARSTVLVLTGSACCGGCFASVLLQPEVNRTAKPNNKTERMLSLTVLDVTSNISNYNGTTPYFPAQVSGVGEGACNQYGTGCLLSSGFTSANRLTAFPNQIRNQYRGPGFFDSDFTINKNFKLTERVAFGVGANFYNVFNHPNFAEPVDTFGAGNFGQILQTTTPPTGPYGAFFPGLPSGRIIQFQGKLVF